MLILDVLFALAVIISVIALCAALVMTHNDSKRDDYFMSRCDVNCLDCDNYRGDCRCYCVKK